MFVPLYWTQLHSSSVYSVSPAFQAGASCPASRSNDISRSSLDIKTWPPRPRRAGGPESGQPSNIWTPSLGLTSTMFTVVGPSPAPALRSSLPRSLQGLSAPVRRSDNITQKWGQLNQTLTNERQETLWKFFTIPPHTSKRSETQ